MTISTPGPRVDIETIRTKLHERLLLERDVIHLSKIVGPSYLGIVQQTRESTKTDCLSAKKSRSSTSPLSVASQI